MLREFTKKALAGAVTHLPAGARRTLLKALVADNADDQFELFRHLGHALRIEYVGVHGDRGVLEGSLEDSVMVGTYARSGAWSPTKTQFLVDFFAHRTSGTYFDIGANIGLTTVPIATNQGVTCIAFEPDPTSFRYLTRNIAANCPAGDVHLHNMAIFDRATTLEFELSESNLADHRVRMGHRDGDFGEQNRDSIRVRAERLDDLYTIDGVQGPIAAKIIAQGSEVHALVGGQALLRHADAMVIQFYPYLLARLDADIAFLNHFLAQNFRSGAMIVADEPQSASWLPMDKLTAQISAVMDRCRGAQYEYFHLLVQK